MSARTGRRLCRVLLPFTAVLVAAACTGDPAQPGAPTPRAIDHVHELLVEPGDGRVLLATHRGLWVAAGGGLEPVGSAQHDLMAATLDEGTILASGHPDLTSKDLVVDGRPPLLGLAASSDGTSWTARSLLGRADFHALEHTSDGTLLGADATARTVRISADGGRTWADGAQGVDLLRLAASPSDAATVLAVDATSRILVTRDGGRSWHALALGGSVPTEAALVDLEWSSQGPVALDGEGVLWRIDLERTRMDAVRPLDDPLALGVAPDGDLYALLGSHELERSADGGVTWTAAGR